MLVENLVGTLIRFLVGYMELEFLSSMLSLQLLELRLKKIINYIARSTKEEKVAHFLQDLNKRIESKLTIRNDAATQSVFPLSRTFGWTYQTRLELLMPRYSAQGLISVLAELHRLAMSEYNIRSLSNGLDSLEISHLSFAQTSSVVR